jgi:hypothetical protein
MASVAVVVLCCNGVATATVVLYVASADRIDRCRRLQSPDVS